MNSLEVVNRAAPSAENLVMPPIPPFPDLPEEKLNYLKQKFNGCRQTPTVAVVKDCAKELGITEKMVFEVFHVKYCILSQRCPELFHVYYFEEVNGIEIESIPSGLRKKLENEYRMNNNQTIASIMFFASVCKTRAYDVYLWCRMKQKREENGELGLLNEIPPIPDLPWRHESFLLERFRGNSATPNLKEMGYYPVFMGSDITTIFEVFRVFYLRDCKDDPYNYEYFYEKEDGPSMDNFEPTVLEELEARFKRNQFPTLRNMLAMAEMSGTRGSEILKWFQRRRERRELNRSVESHPVAREERLEDVGIYDFGDDRFNQVEEEEHGEELEVVDLVQYEDDDEAPEYEDRSPSPDGENQSSGEDEVVEDQAPIRNKPEEQEEEAPRVEKEVEIRATSPVEAIQENDFEQDGDQDPEEEEVHQYPMEELPEQDEQYPRGDESPFPIEDPDLDAPRAPSPVFISKLVSKPGDPDLTQEQKDTLEIEYNKNDDPTFEDIERFAAERGVPFMEVYMWFSCMHLSKACHKSPEREEPGDLTKEVEILLENKAKECNGNPSLSDIQDFEKEERTHFREVLKWFEKYRFRNRLQTQPAPENDDQPAPHSPMNIPSTSEVVRRKRGRPRKIIENNATTSSSEVVPKKRGRPKNSKSNAKPPQPPAVRLNPRPSRF